MTIGENLRKAREAKRLSQEALAKRIGAGKSTYIGWEHNTNPPPADKLILLSQELDTSIDALIFGEDGGISEELKGIFRRFDALPPKMKPQAKSMLGAMLFSLESEAMRQEDAAG